MAARKEKLKGHAAPKPTVDELLDSRDRLNRAGADFMKIDLETALTFLNIARQTQDEKRKTRNRVAARHAYETVKKLATKVTLKEEDMRVITQSLSRLRSELEAMGDIL